jgi:hypothetical protein
MDDIMPITPPPLSLDLQALMDADRDWWNGHVFPSKKYPDTMTFRRFPIEAAMPLIAGLPTPGKYPYSYNYDDDIVDDQQKTKQPENLTMKSFLKGLGDVYKDGKAEWDTMKTQIKYAQEYNGEPMPVDVTNEMNDLLNVYNEALDALVDREDRHLEILNMYMESYTSARKERMTMESKIESLSRKINHSGDCGCDCDDDCGDE